MNGRKTEYTNAQFENAEVNVSRLFETVQNAAPYVEAGEIGGGINVYLTSYGMYGSLNIYRINDKVYLKGVFLALPHADQKVRFSVSKSWAKPPVMYTVADASGNSISISEAGGRNIYVSISHGDPESTLPFGPLMLETTWDYWEL
ncbi:MAG: hypothetical protein IJI87_07470 [Mogibacterium sp.]|nr:hypothetical protein [Mogibacterium sp.]